MLHSTQVEELTEVLNGFMVEFPFPGNERVQRLFNLMQRITRQDCLSPRHFVRPLALMVDRWMDDVHPLFKLNAEWIESMLLQFPPRAKSVKKIRAFLIK